MRPRAWILSLSTVAMAAAMLPLWAAPAAESATPAAAAPAATAAPAAAERKIVKIVRTQGDAPAKQGLVAVRDAETGQLRAPNAAEMAKLAENLDPLFRSDVGLETVYWDDGTITVRLEDRYQSMVLTHKGASGKLEPTCTHDAQKAADVILATPAPETRNDQ